ncbi:helix-turn-helix transcriptional regulator [Celeribacter sp.]|uniref:helix-turn-helix transcriptional regulator n=1 Tax=Celeribacter sp. TaxID=1890673 RepID=UPI003A8D5918
MKIPVKFILTAQVIFTFLFLFKIFADYFAIPLWFVPWTVMEVIEVTASIGMLFGVFSTFALVSQEQARMKNVEMKVDAASGEFSKYLKSQFEEWELSPTEKNITMLVIKGFSNQEIADLRGTSESTVKSQMSNIFRKSNTSSRNQLVTWMLEDVIDRLSADPADM